MTKKGPKKTDEPIRDPSGHDRSRIKLDRVHNLDGIYREKYEVHRDKSISHDSNSSSPKKEDKN